MRVEFFRRPRRPPRSSSSCVRMCMCMCVRNALPLSPLFPPLNTPFHEPADFSSGRCRLLIDATSELSNYAAIIRPRLYISVNCGAVAARRSRSGRTEGKERKREVRETMGSSAEQWRGDPVQLGHGSAL